MVLRYKNNDPERSRNSVHPRLIVFSGLRSLATLFVLEKMRNDLRRISLTIPVKILLSVRFDFYVLFRYTFLTIVRFDVYFACLLQRLD